MRPLRALVLVLAGGLVAATPLLPAAAVPPPAEIGVAIVADIPPPVAGVPYDHYVFLRIGDTPLPGEPIEFQVRQPGTSTFVTIAGGTTNAHGNATIPVTLRRNSVTRWFHPATDNADESTTEPGMEYVQARIGGLVSDLTPKVGQKVVVAGKVFPAKPGRIVRLYAGPNCAYSMIPCRQPTLLAKAYVAQDGSYRLVRRFHKAGHRQVFVAIGETNRNLAGTSSQRHLHIHL